jgi:hypothetical protein
MSPSEEDVSYKCECTTRNGQTVSNSLIVAAYIYDCEKAGERVWFSKIVSNLKTLDKYQISHAIDECFDWMILFGEYGETETGRAGRLLLIDHDARQTIAGLYPIIKTAGFLS